MRSFVGAARAKQPLKGPSGFSEGSQGRRAPGWLPSPGDPSALCAPSSDISAVSTHLGVAAKGALGRPESQVTPCVKPCVLPVSLRVRTRAIMRLHAGAAPSLGPSASPIPYPVVLAFSLVCTPPNLRQLGAVARAVPSAWHALPCRQHPSSLPYSGPVSAEMPPPQTAFSITCALMGL